MIIDPDMPSLGFVIQDIWVFVVVDKDGDESVPAAFVGDVMMPLIAADPARLEWLRPIAKQLARESDRTIKLVRFTQRVDVEVIT